MPSRINIGPEDGPYVAINESSGNLQLEDNSGNVVAEWDETNAQWDFANNTLNNVDALNSNSVSTDEADITDIEQIESGVHTFDEEDLTPSSTNDWSDDVFHEESVSFDSAFPNTPEITVATGVFGTARGIAGKRNASTTGFDIHFRYYTTTSERDIDIEYIGVDQ